MTKDRQKKSATLARVRLLATSDLHMHLTSHDYYTDRPDPTVGLTRISTLIKKARSEAAEYDALTILLDNGDALQGTPLCDSAENTADRHHPLMRSFGHLRYDAIGLGNHDFNFGLKTLARTLRQAPCPVLCSNLQQLCPGKPIGFEPFAILDRMIQSEGNSWPIRIGVVSFLPPQTVTWDAHLLQGRIKADAIVDSARRWVPELRRAGCDLVVALAHTGLSPTPEHAGLENAVLPLATLEGIDAIIAGHTHLHLPGTDHADLDFVDAKTGAVHGKPVIMPGAAGSHLGVIDLDLKKNVDKGWTVAGFDCALRPIAQRQPGGQISTLAEEDTELKHQLADDHADTRALMSQPVGFTAHSLHSYFTFLGFDRALAVVASAQATAVQHLFAGQEIMDLPILSASAPGKFGARAGPEHYTDVPPGPLSLRHVADLHIFPNELRAVIATGTQVMDWLEMSAGLFHRITPGSQRQHLINPDMPGHDFDVLHGLTYEIDLSVPARYNADGTLRSPDSRRIRNLAYLGNLVSSRQEFIVALNSYRAGGGGNVAALKSVRNLPLPRILLRDAIRDHLAGRQPAMSAAFPPRTWKFASMPGTRVTALTGPGAAAHLTELEGRGIEPDGLDENGFLRLQVAL